MPDWTTLAESPWTAIAVRVVIIILLALLATWGLGIIGRQVGQRLERLGARPERLFRLRTLLQVARSAAFILILLFASLMVLHAFSIDITPVLAGAGVAGLALSLGAQTLIKDYIGGVLILLEDQFSMGDVIKVGEVAGAVERVTLRSTYLRDLEGRLHLVPNGDIRTISNLTAKWSRAIVDLNIPYEADMGKVIKTLEAAAARAAEDESIKADLLEAPQALGWIGFKDWAVQVRLMAKTAPGKQWGVMMALRRYAVEALQAQGIRVAVPVPPSVFGPPEAQDT